MVLSAHHFLRCSRFWIHDEDFSVDNVQRCFSAKVILEIAELLGHCTQVLQWDAVSHSQHFKRAQGYNVLERVESAKRKTRIFFDVGWFEEARARPISKPCFCEPSDPLYLL